MLQSNFNGSCDALSLPEGRQTRYNPCKLDARQQAQSLVNSFAAPRTPRFLKLWYVPDLPWRSIYASALMNCLCATLCGIQASPHRSWVLTYTVQHESIRAASRHLNSPGLVRNVAAFVKNDLSVCFSIQALRLNSAPAWQRILRDCFPQGPLALQHAACLVFVATNHSDFVFLGMRAAGAQMTPRSLFKSDR
jgi:hypothetical protein